MNVPLGIYRHYKGKEYEVLGVAVHTETREEFVVYRPLYDDPALGENPMFVRPKEMFLQEVEIDGKNVQRFQLKRES